MKMKKLRRRIILEVELVAMVLKRKRALTLTQYLSNLALNIT
jgi:hypothetical protein